MGAFLLFKSASPQMISENFTPETISALTCHQLFSLHWIIPTISLLKYHLSLQKGKALQFSSSNQVFFLVSIITKFLELSIATIFVITWSHHPLYLYFLKTLAFLVATLNLFSKVYPLYYLFFFKAFSLASSFFLLNFRLYNKGWKKFLSIQSKYLVTIIIIIIIILWHFNSLPRTDHCWHFYVWLLLVLSLGHHLHDIEDFISLILLYPLGTRTVLAVYVIFKTELFHNQSLFVWVTIEVRGILGHWRPCKPL